MEGNLYLNGAVPPVFDKHPVVLADVKPPFRLVNADGLVEWSVDPAWLRRAAPCDRHCQTSWHRPSAGLPYEMPDGSPVKVDRDFSEVVRSSKTPCPAQLRLPVADAFNGFFTGIDCKSKLAHLPSYPYL